MPKTCSRCDEAKPETEYTKDKKRKDGLDMYCKACKSAKGNAYYAANRDKERVRKAKFYKEHTGKVMERINKYRATTHGKEIIAKHNKRWASTNRDKLLAQRAMNLAVKAGKFPPITDLICIECSEPAGVYHHESYLANERLNVQALCRTCHAEVHRQAAA